VGGCVDVFVVVMMMASVYTPSRRHYDVAFNKTAAVALLLKATSQ